MNAAPAPPAPEPPWRRRPEFWLALAVALYGFGYLLWFLGTPVGRAPQLDARENVELARQIAEGALAREPFYRAMLYPGLLALPLLAGVPSGWLTVLAPLFELLCHFASTLAVAWLAARVWDGPRSRPAALLAAALWGLNPVALFYAVDIHDTALALALFLWGLLLLAGPSACRRRILLGGALLGLAAAARPNYFPVLLVAPFARAWLSGRWRPVSGDFLTWAGIAIPLLLLGGIQYFWAGEFRVLPWQGAYNFHAANRPGANGRYFVQQLYIADLSPGANPARAESEILYARETGSMPPFSPAVMETYWNARAREAIAADPGAWLTLLARKAVFALNDFDQYNNKTYAWHRAESPWLRWNSLGWGILMILAAPCLVCGLAQHRASVAGVAAVGVVYAAGLLLYYVSGRFRLPLMPLLCVVAGGFTLLPAWRREQQLQRRTLGCYTTYAAIVAACVVSFIPWPGVRDTSTFVQDEMLTANAAAELGEDAAALAYAQRALARDASRPDARRIALVSQFNLSLAGDESDWPAMLPLLEGLEMQDASLALAAGVVCWKNGQLERAEKIWADAAARMGAQSPPGQALRAALTLRHGAPPPADPQAAQWLDYLRAR